MRFAAAAKPLMALTRDEELLAALRNVTDPVHEVCAIGAEVELSTALMAHHAGVAVLDCAAARHARSLPSPNACMPSSRSWC